MYTPNVYKVYKYCIMDINYAYLAKEGLVMEANLEFLK